MTTQRGIAKIIVPKEMTNAQFAQIQDGIVWRRLQNDHLHLIQRLLTHSEGDVKSVGLETVFLYLRAMSRTCTRCGEFSEFEGFSQWVRPRNERPNGFYNSVILRGPAFHCSNCCYDFKKGCFRDEKFGRVCEVRDDKLIFYSYDVSKKTPYVFELVNNKFPDCPARAYRSSWKVLNSARARNLWQLNAAKGSLISRKRSQRR
jgi:hypothetical protein